MSGWDADPIGMHGRYDGGSTMESKKKEGLYLCGELLDVDCDTGGYNLQCAFSTGFLAGESAAKSLTACKLA